MNRLQKKCVIATVGIHLLLVVILIVGPAFFNPKPKVDDAQMLDVIPADLIDAAFNSGVKNATPPSPQSNVQPQPPQPQPQQQPVPPAQKPPEPKPSIVDEVKKYFKPEPKPEPVKPAPKRVEIPKHTIQPNLTLTSRSSAKSVSNPRDTRAISSAIKNLRKNLKPGTVVDAPGSSTVAYASYKDALATIYYDAWITPNNAADSGANTMVKIVVASDGTVISSRIVTPSGDSNIDASVQRALDRVNSVPPLPDKSKAQQEFTMSFNLKTKQMLE